MSKQINVINEIDECLYNIGKICIPNNKKIIYAVTQIELIINHLENLKRTTNDNKLFVICESTIPKVRHTMNNEFRDFDRKLEIALKKNQEKKLNECNSLLRDAIRILKIDLQELNIYYS